MGAVSASGASGASEGVSRRPNASGADVCAAGAFRFPGFTAAPKGSFDPLLPELDPAGADVARAVSADGVSAIVAGAIEGGANVIKDAVSGVCGSAACKPSLDATRAFVLLEDSPFGLGAVVLATLPAEANIERMMASAVRASAIRVSTSCAVPGSSAVDEPAAS